MIDTQIEKLKPDIRFFTEEEIFTELQERFPNYIFIAEEVTKTHVTKAKNNRLIWFQGSEVMLLGLLSYAKLRVKMWLADELT